MGPYHEEPPAVEEESPALEELKHVVGLSRLPTFFRDAALEHIRQTGVQKLARLFSHEICGPDGDINLRNADYRLLLGVLRTAQKMNDAIDLRRAWDTGMRSLEARCHPSMQSIISRLRLLTEYSGVKCGPRRRLADVQRLIELSYPLGTILTDPNGGENSFLPANGAIRINPSTKPEVRSSVEMMPDDGETAVHHILWEDETSYAVQNTMGNGTFMTLGKESYLTSFFQQEFNRNLAVTPFSNLGDDHPLPGWILVVRSRDRIAVLLKNLGGLMFNKKSANRSEYGDVKTMLKTHGEIGNGNIVRVQYWDPPEADEKSGSHFKNSPSVTYSFSTGVHAVDEPFGATVRTPTGSSQ